MGEKKKGVNWFFVLLQGGALALALYLIVINVHVSPGDLSAVHAREPVLDGSTGCKECHGPGRNAALSESCAACHQDIQRQLVAKSGFHGSLASDLGRDCGTCHFEHKGKDFAPVNVQSFAQAGIPDASVYAHETLDFHLSGRHLALDCTICHSQAEARVLEKGAHRFTGLEQTCTACHRDVHKGSFGTNCRSCHGEEQPFKAVAGFRHTDAFPLTGSHAGHACSACHEPGTPQAVSALVAPSDAPPATVRGCVACHRSPHGADFLAKVAQPIGLAPENTCTRCHSAEQKNFLGPHATVTRKQHSAVGFPLTAPHDKVACSACHAEYTKSLPGDLLETYHRRYPGRRPEDCKACHQDPHRGEFEIGAFKGKDCLSCHGRLSFQPPEFDMAKHDEVFKLEGKHRKLDCAQCHAKSDAAGPRDYRNTPVDCRQCHQDPHGGQFNKPIYLGNDCRVCHTQHSWKPPTFTVGMHDKTSFALTGAHLGLACTRCHEVPAPSKDAKPCPRAFAGIASTCASCHKDVHAGKFDGPGKPVSVAGQTECARCHGTDTFRTLTSKTFDHPLWTGYALKGAHAALDCAVCHGRSATPDALGRTLGPAAGTQCQSCHADPHVGQFGSPATASCTKCHREEGPFRSVTFDHQKDSRFALDEVHVKLACSKCHKAMPAGPDTKAIRYKPLGIKCGDCHDPRGAK